MTEIGKGICRLHVVSPLTERKLLGVWTGEECVAMVTALEPTGSVSSDVSKGTTLVCKPSQCWELISVGWSYAAVGTGVEDAGAVAAAVRQVFAGEWEGWDEKRQRLWGVFEQPTGTARL